MPAITWGAPARPRCNRQFVTLLAMLLTLLVALSAPAMGLGRAARPWWERAAWNLRAWHAVRSLPGPGQEAGHFRVWLPGAAAVAPDAAVGADTAIVAGVGGRIQGPGRGAGKEVPPELVEQLEAAYGRVTADLGVEPPGLVPLVLYRDRSALERRVGAAAGGATGLYAAGVIHLLWQEDLWWEEGWEWDEHRQEDLWWQTDLRGPLAHEMTHYLLDLVAPGRVPRWFQEGLAQLEEYRLTGKVLYDVALASPIPWAQLEAGFDELPDDVAYGASLSLVSFLYHEGGDGAVRQMVDALLRGASFARAINLAWGCSLEELDARRLACRGAWCVPWE